ncbi:lipoate--protein ligase family protein [Tautonia plasticadhaerens]|uniref:Octanoyltransferase LipM n=1 Tax=Tautonia plasticadhaerens TaxID=2527974 RepID=A0A518H2X9_9BACT|nr:lipoate--protein ligase [Tautonia plasticadhaerens]QDV35192.1 Octanoyltransferase LipM [Tautonia plasticadhaerens]
MHCRVLPHAAGDGPWNMAVDQWMLERVAGGECAGAMLRTYEWSVPTLSLGYFQSRSEAEADPRWRGAGLVRRATGGGAIWHDRELTYALAVPSSHPMARGAKDLYRAVHAAIAGLLADRGVEVRRRGEQEARVGRDRPLLCFADRDAEDLVVSGSKVLGSAQRRKAGALLQHGSLLLFGSERTPELPGLEGLCPGLGAGPASAWAGPVWGRIAAALGLVEAERGLSAEEREAVLGIAGAVFGDPGWTDRR